MKQLSIVIPCYNPAPGWEQHVQEAYHAIVHQLKFMPELIVVNDGSLHPPEDHTITFLREKITDFTYTGYPVNKGKGAALRHGVALARGSKIIYTDIDFPYTTDSLLRIWEQLQQDRDLVIGIKDKEYYQHVPRSRVAISKALRKMSGFFFRMPVTDTQCGLKGFNQKGKSIFLSTTINRYLCDLEFVYKSFRSKPKLDITTQEVSLKEEIQFRKMNYKILISEGFNFLKILFSSK
jgi:glycosyltransferase involved in cell wall biosynthesis